MIKALLAFIIVAFGLPAFSPLLGLIASACGYALFWHSVRSIRRRALVSFLWSSSVSLVQLSWFASSYAFQGLFIIWTYLGIALALGGLFAFLMRFVPREGPFTHAHLLAFASAWTLLECGRFHFLCGMSWNPVGSALTGSTLALGSASLFGVLGLSFWVIYTNGSVYNYMLNRQRVWLPALCILTPYIVGAMAQAAPELGVEPITVALVQPGLTPEQKVPIARFRDKFIPLYNQWDALFTLLRKERSAWDLIVLPELAIHSEMSRPLYTLGAALELLHSHFGKQIEAQLPPLQEPFAQLYRGEWIVSNRFFAQAMANLFASEVVMGGEHYDRKIKGTYTAALHFKPGETSMQVAPKQKLVPGEYLPFEWARSLAAYYGINDFFEGGAESMRFDGKTSFTTSICYDETFPEVVRSGRLKGAQMLVAISNDNWYPTSRLPLHHLHHARVRAVENGAPLVRACNTGVTCVVDKRGIVRAQLPSGEGKAGVLTASLVPSAYKTPYLFWGDGAIVSISLICLAFYLRMRYASTSV